MNLINRKTKLIIFAAFIGMTALFYAFSVAKMQENSANLSNIEYPVKELDGCKSESDCKAYCNKSQNIEACVNFAEKHNLMSSEEVEQAKKFIAAGSKGPGGCTSKDSCENYCNDTNHINECIDFAEKSGIIPLQELEEAKKVKSALERGAKIPGGCRNKKECDNYCSASEHIEECVAFGEAAGFIPPDELVQAKKMVEAIKKGVKPLPCRGKNECDSYCGLEEHFEECVNFAETAGFMSSEEAVMARKTGGKGPGDCKGKEECNAFCQKPENQETCFDFGKEHGLIPEEDLKQMEEGKQKMKEGLSNAPPEVLDCLTEAFGGEFINKLKNGAAFPSKEMGDKMRGCFEKMGPPKEMPPGAGGEGMPGGPQEKMMPPENFVGPGGCKTPEECKNYCNENPDQCVQFRSSQKGEQMPQERREIEIRERVSPEGIEMRRRPEGEEMKFPEGARPHGDRIPQEGMPQQPPAEQQPQMQMTLPPAGEFKPPIIEQIPQNTMPVQPQMEQRMQIQTIPPTESLPQPSSPPQSYNNSKLKFSAVEAIRFFGASIFGFYSEK